MFPFPSSLPIDPALIVTIDQLPGYRIVRTLGIAEGVSVSLFTGFGPGQSAVLFEAMREAFLDMMNRAAAQDAQAVIGLRYAIPSTDDERIVIAYGTAVKIEPL